MTTAIRAGGPPTGGGGRAGATCKECGVDFTPKQSTQRYCSFHCRARAAVRRRYHRLTTQGRCYVCGQPAEDGRNLCAGHRRLKNAEAQARRQLRREAGLCAECGAPAEAGRKLCVSCRVSRYVASARWVRRNKTVALYLPEPIIDRLRREAIRRGVSMSRLAAAMLAATLRAAAREETENAAAGIPSSHRPHG